MQTTEIPRFGITITHDKEGGTIQSDDLLDKSRSPEWLMAMDGLLNLVLGHACAGIDVRFSVYQDGINSALNRLYEKYGP
jgi:hypothetical protein